MVVGGFLALLVWYSSRYSASFQFFPYVLGVCPFRHLRTIFFVAFQQSNEAVQYFLIFWHKPYYVDWKIIPANICWSSRRLQRKNFSSSKASWNHLGKRKIVSLKTSWRHLEDISWRRLEGMSWRRLEGMSWRRLENMSWTCLQDILETNKMFTGDICI